MSVEHTPEMLHALTDRSAIGTVLLRNVWGHPGVKLTWKLRRRAGRTFIHMNIKRFTLSLKTKIKICEAEQQQSLGEDLTCVGSHGHVSEQTLHGGCPSLCFGPALGHVGPDLPAPRHPFPPLPRWVPVQHQQWGRRGSGAAATHQLRQRQHEAGFLPRAGRQTLDVYVGVGEGQGIVGGQTGGRRGSRR